MAPLKSGRTVFSTERGEVCARCGWPIAQCRCASSFDQPVPAKIVARLRIEKQGRGGKTVTVLDSLPRNGPFLKSLSTELKRACGAGGTAGDGFVEVQGDHREKLRVVLAGKGWAVKG